MNWTEIKEIPGVYADVISAERVDDKFATLIVDLPGRAPLRLTGCYYTSAIKVHSPKPPEEVKVYAVKNRNITLHFESKNNAEDFASDVGSTVETLRVMETDLADYALADAVASTLSATIDHPF